MSRTGMTDTEYVAGLRARWAYHDANGRPLIGPCDVEGCPYQSPPGGGLCAEHAKITVRKLRQEIEFRPRNLLTTYRSVAAWGVYRNGYRDDTLAVVDGVSGLTIVGRPNPWSNWTMMTSWHAGITPGDLARHVLAREARITESEARVLDGNR